MKKKKQYCEFHGVFPSDRFFILQSCLGRKTMPGRQQLTHCRFHTREHIEHFVQHGQFEDALHLRGEVGQPHPAPALAGGFQSRDERRQPGTVHERDTRQIEDEFDAPGVGQSFDVCIQLRRADCIEPPLDNHQGAGWGELFFADFDFHEVPPNALPRTPQAESSWLIYRKSARLCD